MKKLFVFSLLLLAGRSYGGTISWANNMYPATVDPSGNGTDLGVTSKTIADDTNTPADNITATSLNITNLSASSTIGFSFTPTLGTTVDLGWKNQGAPALEHGLGIMDAADGEIRNTYALQINFSSISFLTMALTVDSIDDGTSGNEGYRIWGSTTANGPMTLLAEGLGSSGFVQTVAGLPNTYSYFDLTSNTPGDPISSLILRSAAATTSSVPEPATLAMMGLGLVAVGYMRLRKRG
jgi:hypothetical protein